MSDEPPAAPPEPTLEQAPKPGVRNKVAMASAVLALFGFIPFIAGAAAMIIGFAGYRKAKRDGVGGRDMAIFGMVVGLLSVVGWTLATGQTIGLIMRTGPVRQVTSRFVQDLVANRLDEARALTSDEVPPDAIASAAATIAPLVPLEGIGFDKTDFQDDHGQEQWNIHATLHFKDELRPMNVKLRQFKDGWKIISFTID
jgi:hypothetical protein